MTRTEARELACAAAAAMALVGCSGHGDGGGGDPPSEPGANPYGTGARISDLLGPATWENENDPDSLQCVGVPYDRYVSVSGVSVTAIDRYDETGDGSMGNVYVQDTMLDPIPYSGVTVYAPTFSPPDLRPIEGDVVDLFGLLTEFPGPSTSPFNNCRTLPEIGGTMTFRFDDGGVQPKILSEARVLASYAGMREWLGMLVTIENLTLAEDPPSQPTPSGRYSIDIDVGGGVLQRDVPELTNEHFDLQAWVEERSLSAGSQLRSVTGIVTYFYATHLSPRSAADIVE